MLVTCWPITFKEDKHSRELQTMEYLKDLLEPFNPTIGTEIMSIWQEYEDGITPEAIFVKDGLFPYSTEFLQPTTH